MKSYALRERTWKFEEKLYNSKADPIKTKYAESNSVSFGCAIGLQSSKVKFALFVLIGDFDLHFTGQCVLSVQLCWNGEHVVSGG